MQRVLRGKPATINLYLTDQDGIGKDASGAVTVTATRDSDGSAVTTGTVTIDTGYKGHLTVDLNIEATEDLDLLTLIATDAGSGATHTEIVEVVGDYFFSIEEARTVVGSLRRTDDYPVEDLIRARLEVEIECERICGQAFVPRYAREQVDGYGSSSLLLSSVNPQRIRSVALDGSALAAEQLDVLRVDGSGLLEWSGSRWPEGQLNVSVAYEHGMSQPPADLKRAAMTRLRQRLNMANSGVDDRTTTFSSAEGGSFSLAVPGRGGFETGSPDVDAVYERYKVRAAAVA